MIEEGRWQSGATVRARRSRSQLVMRKTFDALCRDPLRFGARLFARRGASRRTHPNLAHSNDCWCSRMLTGKVADVAIWPSTPEEAAFADSHLGTAWGNNLRCAAHCAGENGDRHVPGVAVMAGRRRPSSRLAEGRLFAGLVAAGGQRPAPALIHAALSPSRSGRAGRKDTRLHFDSWSGAVGWRGQRSPSSGDLCGGVGAGTWHIRPARCENQIGRQTANPGGISMAGRAGAPARQWKQNWTSSNCQRSAPSLRGVQ